MTETTRSIPRPLVKVNQSVIVISVLLTWIFNFEWFLLVPFISGLLGLLFGYNPVIKFASLFLRRAPNTYIPEDWDQQQFNQKIAITCLGIGFISFYLGWTILGYVFTILVALAASIAILGFCVGCFIHFQLKQYKYRQSIR